MRFLLELIANLRTVDFNQVREAAARLRSIDFAAIEDRVGKAEQAFNELRIAQQQIAGYLLAGRGSAPLISPLELKTGNRFALEDRCRALTNSAYLGDHTVLCRVLGLFKMYVDTNDTGFASHLMLEGFWEMWLTVFFARHVQAKMTVVDVGANFGYYTLLFGFLVGSEGHVYAVEPNPTVAPKLRRSVDLNGLAARTTIIEAAAGAIEGEVSLFAPDGEPKNSAVVASDAGIAPDSGKLYKVPQIKLDKLAATVSRIDLVKVDAEGAEQDVLSGMEGILRRDKPCLLLEFNAGRYADPMAFIAWLRGLYGRMRYIDFDGNPTDVTPEHLLSDRSGEDWLLLFDEPVMPTG
jgi:FkbM family methyltransferase